MAAPTAFVRADVVLEGGADLEPVVGSFTVDGLTYAVTGEGEIELASVSDGAAGASAAEDAAVSDSDSSQQASEPAEDEGSSVASMLASRPDGALDLPSSIDYDGAAYSLTSIAPYAFHLSSVEEVTIPATVTDVDGRTFRSCAVSSVEVADGSFAYSSYDGALYSADLASLLSIPGGRTGAVRIPSQTEEVLSSAFSHCAGVGSISVDAGSAAFLSWDDCLYDVSGETLLRVPAGATDITIKDGCTAIAAGAMEGCAKLESITAPASVASISPYVFSQEPATVSLPAATLADGSSPEAASAVQLSSTVALTASDDSLPEVDPSSIQVALPEGADASAWRAAGLSLAQAVPAGEGPAVASSQEGSAYSAAAGFIDVNVYPSHHTLMCELWVYDVANGRWFTEISRNPITDSAPFAWNGNPQAVTAWEAWSEGYAGLSAGGFVYFGQTGYLGYPPTLYYQFARLYGDTEGYTLVGFNPDPSATTGVGNTGTRQYYSIDLHAIWRPNNYTIQLDAQGGSVSQSSVAAAYGQDVTLPEPTRSGYRFLGWDTAPDGTGERYQAGPVRNLTGDDKATVPLYAIWSYSLSFDTSSEPGDADYPGDDMASKPVAPGDGQVAIDPPTRPGYVFQGWVVDGKPNDTGLLTEGPDGTWSVDASKLPEYADGNGKVDLTARWTAAISVDAPISATFMYDLSAWDGTESRDAMTIEGSSTVRNRSAIPIRVSGLESETGSAANVLKKADGTTLADASKGDAAKVLSVFPTTSDATGTESDAKGGATDDAGDDLAHKVDLALSEIKLEEAFDADAWAIPAGASANGAVTTPGEAKLGYRLNLGSSTGVTLDKDALLAATGDPEAGSSSKAASIADLTYCFAADWNSPADWGEPLWIENPDRTSNPAKHLLLADIKEAAEDLSAKGTGSEHYDLYKGLLDAQVTSSGNPGPGPYFQLLVDGRYLPLQLIGICQDVKSDGTGKAGLTFQMKDIYCYSNQVSTMAGGGSFPSYLNVDNIVSGGWEGTYARNTALRAMFADKLSPTMQAAIAPVDKCSQLSGSTAIGGLQKTSGETIWFPSIYEVYGTAFSTYNESEGLITDGYSPFQYQAYQGNDGSAYNAYAIKRFNGANLHWWMRSVRSRSTEHFGAVGVEGACVQGSPGSAFANCGVVPAFCL